jgi:ATP-binding cassette subfamily B protein
MEDTSASLMDMVEMAQITRAHALEDTEIKKMTHNLGKVANTGYSLDLYQSILVAAQWMTFTIFQFLCLIFSAYMAYSGNILVGDISLYQSYFATLTGYVSSFVALIPLMSKGIESVYSISEILSSTSIENNDGKMQLESLRGEYEFRDVCFGYSEESPLIKGFNLHIKHGETIAIVGESGSGKSTLLNLIIGFNTVRSGEVLIDGVNINDIDLHSYRRHIAIVPQNSVLFTGTIRENITYGIPDATDKKIATAIEAANLSSFISTLPDGVDTMLTEHGANLSGGQRQRLSIARAIIRGADVIILDEATSALDNVSEREIQNAISNLAKGRTTFIVAHRLSTIKNADRIAVLKNGVCVEIGSYDELMEKRGEFYAMQTAT